MAYSMTYDDFAKEVARYLGFGRSVGSWSSAMLGDIDASIQAGLRQFYSPPPIPMGVSQVMTGYRWRFLEPQGSIAIDDSTDIYDLPSDFGGINGPITFQQDSNINFNYGITIVPIGHILKLLQNPQLPETSQPKLAALYPEASDPGDGVQVWKIRFWPKPDRNYTIEFPYRVLLSNLTDGDMPYGGELHSEAMLASMLSVAEERFTEPNRGTMKESYMDRLKASIEIDRQFRQSASFGYNGDSSDALERRQRPHQQAFRVSYDGLFYPGGTPNP